MYIDGDDVFIELGRQLANVQELSATEGIQLLQDCIMAAAHLPKGQVSKLPA